MKKANPFMRKTLIYLSLIVLISSCKKDETNSTVTPQGGTGELVEANVTASFDYTSNSIPNKQFGSNMTYESIADSVIYLGDGNFMKAELLVEDGIVSESISSDNIYRLRNLTISFFNYYCKYSKPKRVRRFFCNLKFSKDRNKDLFQHQLF